MRKGFTLIELLVVVTIIAILAPAWAEDVKLAGPPEQMWPTAEGVVDEAGGTSSTDTPDPLPQGGGDQRKLEAAQKQITEERARTAAASEEAKAAKARADAAEAEIERQTVVVRRLAAAHQRGDQAAVRRLSAELKSMTGRLAEVEANPLGGMQGQRAMWGELHDAGVKSESYYVQHYGLEPVQPVESNLPATPAKGRGSMTGTEWLLLALIVAAAATAIAFALRGTRMDILATALGDAANRLQGGERMEFSSAPGRMRLRVEPANATPVIPPPAVPAPQQPAVQQAAPGQAYVPVTFSPVNVTLAPVAPQAPAPQQPAPAPAPQAQQPVQVWFNNNLGPQPQARQPQAPQGQQPAAPAQGQQGGAQPQQRNPRNPRPNQPAAGAGNPPAQGGGQPLAGNP